MEVVIMRFKKNDTFQLNNKTVKVLDFLGEGGQGEVYLVSYNGDRLAFKFYKNKVSKDFKHNLVANIKKGTPLKTFLWPKEYIEFVDGYCGYLMDLRSNDYVSFVSYLNGKVTFDDEYLKLKWCIELVKSFKFLHERGYSYQDLNDGSFFLNPHTGDLLICDNDNVTADKKNLGVIGKMRYMAPEIVRGDRDRITKQPQLPDIHTDRFSLAVILFMVFCLGNPFEGEHLKNYVFINEQAEQELFGKKIVYIYSELDKSNRPIRGYHTAVIKRYPLLPDYMKASFHRTFVEGLKDRENKRTTELEWLKLLTRYRDELCTYSLKNLCVLDINSHHISLEPKKHLYLTHIDKCSDEYNTSIGEVIANKNNPSLWGIKLNYTSDIEIKDTKGVIKQISKNGVIPIIKGLKIKFNENTIGIIH